MRAAACSIECWETLKINALYGNAFTEMTDILVYVV